MATSEQLVVSECNSHQKQSVHLLAQSPPELFPSGMATRNLHLDWVAKAVRYLGAQVSVTSKARLPMPAAEIVLIS